MLEVTEAAPRVTPEDIDNAIVRIDYLNAGVAVNKCAPKEDALPADHRLYLQTICILTLKNGFVVFGTSGCVSAANYDKGVGESVALANAKEQLWPLLGYELRSKLLEA